jgi:hypothetical protein
MTATGLMILAIALLVPSAAASARILPPGQEAAFGRAEIDLNRTGRVAVAYERALPGPNLIRVAVRVASRLGAPTLGRPIGRGALRLVRLGDAPADRHVVVWRRAGETVASVWRGGRWRTERLPAPARRLEPLAGAVVGRRVLLVLGDRSRVVAALRTPSGGWRALALPATGGARSGLVAAASEGAGLAVAAWSEGPAAGRSIGAATFSLATGRWSAPQTVIPAGAVTAGIVAELVLDDRGDAALSAVTDPGRAGPPSTPAAALLARDATAWVVLPALDPDPARPPQLALTAAGLPVRAWLEGDEVRVSELAADGLSWQAPETALRRPPDDFGELYAVDDLAVDRDGRVVIVVAIDPGPGPDDHAFLVRPSAGGAFGAPRSFASLYGSPRLVVGGAKVAASWVEDPSSSGLAEAVLAP